MQGKTCRTDLDSHIDDVWVFLSDAFGWWIILSIMLFITCCLASPHTTTRLQLSHIVGQLITVPTTVPTTVPIKGDVECAECDLLPRDKMQLLNKMQLAHAPYTLHHH